MAINYGKGKNDLDYDLGESCMQQTKPDTTSKYYLVVRMMFCKEYISHIDSVTSHQHYKQTAIFFAQIPLVRF